MWPILEYRCLECWNWIEVRREHLPVTAAPADAKIQVRAERRWLKQFL